MATKYILCLDTDHYAGNFERETTAYATGAVGDCGVGDEQAIKFFGSTDGVTDRILDEIDTKIVRECDEDDHCSRPCAIQATPGWVNDGMSGDYRQSMETPPTEEQVAIYRKALRDYHLPHLEQARKNVAAGLENWTSDGLKIAEQEYHAINAAELKWYPAYYTIGIFLSHPLSDETLRFIVNRVREYFTKPMGFAHEMVKLEAVRLITISKESSETLLEI